MLRVRKVLLVIKYCVKQISTVKQQVLIFVSHIVSPSIQYFYQCFFCECVHSERHSSFTLLCPTCS